MSDKPIAGLVTLAASPPLCAVCVLGPATVAAIVASLAGWFGGLAPSANLAVAAGGAALGYWLWRHRGQRRMRGKRST